jgi:hypothetical protein
MKNEVKKKMMMKLRKMMYQSHARGFLETKSQLFSLLTA